MALKLTQFTLFSATPLKDMGDSIHFADNAQRDNYFSNAFEQIHFETPFNFIRDRGKIRVNIDYDDIRAFNYCSYRSDFEPNIRYYAFIIDHTYLNDNCVELQLIPDPLMTFCQGSVLESLKNLYINRQHLSKDGWAYRKRRLLANDDILSTKTNRYIYQNRKTFNEFWIVMQSSVDLEGTFGTVDAPVLQTSAGQTYDHLTSPINLYVIDSMFFNGLMANMTDYPWITQNIKKVNLIPKEFIDQADLVEGDPKETAMNTTFYKFANDKTSNNYDLDMSFSIAMLMELCGLDANDEHLFRAGYITIELSTNDGQLIALDPNLLPDTGLELRLMQTNGYFNEIAIYPKSYSTNGEISNLTPWGTELDDQGTFLNNALFFKDFNEVPIAIDNYKLSMANSAYSRQYEQSQLLSNQMSNVVNGDSLTGDNSLMGRVNSALGVVGGFSGGIASGVKSLLSGAFDEHNYYVKQRAQFKQMALSAPTITTMSNGQSFPISNGFYGITIKISAPDDQELDWLRKYYNSYGFEIEERMTSLEPVDSMLIMNYIQFSGPWTTDDHGLNDIDPKMLSILRAQLASGVRLWHFTGEMTNPMGQDLLGNVRVK